MTAPARAGPLEQVAPDGSRWRRRRRPLGGVAALDRPIYPSGHLYVTLTVAVLVAWGVALLLPGLAGSVDALDAVLLEVLAEVRTDGLVSAAEAVESALGGPLWRALVWLAIGVGLAARRVRHVAVLVALLLAVLAVTAVAAEAIGRGPVTEVPVLGTPEPVTHPAGPVVQLGLALVGAMYVLAPRGRARNRAKVGAGVVVGLLVAARLLLGLDHPTDAFVALVLGMAVPVVGFRYLVPDASFPVTYRRRGAASLGAGEVAAIEAGVARQLGWTVDEVVELRPPGSAGSTPLLLRLDPADGTAPREVFAKLYSLTHLRADRWYKLARAIRYGRLEDEAPFGTVRQLVEHEDYMLRVAEAEGLPVPRSHGLLELVPGRAYLLVMESLPGARQLGDVTASPEQVDQGLAIVDGLWAAGIAHRDIKPANLVVSEGELYLVDLSFGEVAPTPWRQAVDLADMLLCLGLSSDADLVYRRAVQWFTPAEVAEAFATTSSVTIPAQLRRLLRERSPDLVERFRALAPPRSPIAIQRWNSARVALAAAVLAAAVGVVALLAFNLSRAGLL